MYCPAAGASAEYISESEDEADLNAILRQVDLDSAAETAGNLGALSQLYSVDERKRTDIFRPRRSLLWTVGYILFGIGLPGLAAIGLLIQMVM